uniref:Uncharacterized protein n=1 Tax=Medicago truncatula TaxID=3880 RepID=Q2HUJ8_MEDTR|nr:hypothetical protein MtrDRAFT_AC149131g34v2 [Medicago truncatula]
MEASAVLSGVSTHRAPIKGVKLLSEEMCKKNQIWVVIRMQIVVDRYPTWETILQQRQMHTTDCDSIEELKQFKER